MTRLFLGLILYTLTCLCGFCQEKPEVSSLFNGTDLQGWKVVGGTGKFTVIDGSILGYGENIKGNTFLRTKKTYKNFILTYQFKFKDRTGNSGVMFRALQKPSKDGNGRVFGYQCEADHKDRHWSAGLFDEARRGWLYPSKADTGADSQHRDAFTTQGAKLFHWDKWNTIKIKCKGNQIQTWLNGEQRVNYTDTDPEYDTREGFIALQVHSGKSCKVMWKNLQIQLLP